MPEKTQLDFFPSPEPEEAPEQEKAKTGKEPADAKAKAKAKKEPAKTKKSPKKRASRKKAKDLKKLANPPHGTKGDFVKVTVTLPPDIYQKIMLEATRRKMKKEDNPLLSAIIREAVVEYLEK